MTPPAAPIDPQQLTISWDGESAPYAIVDLDAVQDATPWHLPPCPLIGIGTPDHPRAKDVDLLIEAPVSLAIIAAAIDAQPKAAAVLVQLLRLIANMDAAPALVAESLAYGLLQGSDAHAQWLATRTPAPASPPGDVRLDRTDDQLIITLDRAHAHNAIDRAMRDDLRGAFDLAALDCDIARISLRGEGRSFSVGADLSEFGTTRDPATAHAIRMVTLPAHAIVRCADRLDVHVQGACVGSALEMAAFATRLTASPSAWFHLPELAMGIIPGAGGCVSVSRRIGRQRAALMILSGRRISAATALDWGLIDAFMDD
ncbi:enoyl-CoA hydratase/isomerase family protein [Sphingobium terrigena]|uniref:Enoyl-CoA hydratase/isomerase family protein n=1 Tax=Sphingobium terrigena TaxID=2304063 RepID=A0A418YVQ2_9SPHN|nr:enoyl-CoA hydratase/isomerase family protein [Sphingobium terrigena]RJG56269.1 enoyl-CoA hydratase/isomerase family protein [Sphingobium terrigena]